MAKKKLKTRKLVALGLFVVAVTLAFTFVTNLYHLFELKQKQAIIEDRLAEVTFEQEELSAEIIRLQDDEYVARYARGQYRFTAPGEKVIILPENNDE